MMRANLAGPSAPDLSLPSLAQPEELRSRIEAGEWVLDLRNGTAFAAGHVPGTFKFGIDGAFAIYLGWLIDSGTPVTLLGETQDQVQHAQRELVRIGIDRPASAATGTPHQWTTRPLESFPQATFADLDQVRHHREVVILDVRRTAEVAKARIAGAINISIHDLPRRIHEVPDSEVWGHCVGGYRAAVAASFLGTAGRTLVAIDDTFDNAEATGLHLITE
jgi:rhodanese-related sulfurtransferase